VKDKNNHNRVTDKEEEKGPEDRCSSRPRWYHTKLLRELGDSILAPLMIISKNF
jgi:hypothetical protein